MTSAFVITTNDLTVGLLARQGKALQFEAYHSSMLPLQHRCFSTPEAATRAVEKLMGGRVKPEKQAMTVSFRRVW
jgi:hypothetical protein